MAEPTSEPMAGPKSEPTSELTAEQGRRSRSLADVGKNGGENGGDENPPSELSFSATIQCHRKANMTKYDQIWLIHALPFYGISILGGICINIL